EHQKRLPDAEAASVMVWGAGPPIVKKYPCPDSRGRVKSTKSVFGLSEDQSIPVDPKKV
ncbi:Hypothetical protein FKW44_023067, partial [Caligus rogercresseyi]